MVLPSGSPLRFSRNLVLVVVLVVFSLPATAESLPDHAPDATVDRAAIPDVYKWDLTPLFPSDEAWDKALTGLSKEIGKLEAYRGKLEDPAALEACLDLYFDLHNRVNHVTMYANLKLTTAQSDTTAQAMQQHSLKLLDELMATATFIRAELLELPAGTLGKAYGERPGLAARRPYIEDIVRRRERVLNPEAERILSLAGDNLWAEIDLNEIPAPTEDAFRAMMNTIPWPVVHDEQGNEVQLTLANYGRFRASKDRKVRREAVSAFMATLKHYEDALAATLAGQFKLDVTYARARKYDTALEAYLDKDNLDTAVFDNLVSTVNANLKPLHRYVELRKKVMGLDDLHLYDLYVPMVPTAAVEVPFPEARQTLLASLKPLGPEYMSMLDEGLDPANGWLDLYPSNDKDSGASSSSVYGPHPFIKMNYQDSLDDMSTLAHEYGHALHSVLAMENQPYSSFRYVSFLAEIASTCNEKLLSDYLVAHARDDATKAYILSELAEGIRTTIYRQTLFAEFERAVHGFVEDGVPVTADLLDRTYGDLVRRYYGPGFTVGENDVVEWAYIPHFYWKYYVFNYATGLSSGIAIAERIQEGTPGAVGAYMDMLRGGCAKPPLELLKAAGVDLTRPDAIESALKLFDKTVRQLEDLL